MTTAPEVILSMSVKCSLSVFSILIPPVPPPSAQAPMVEGPAIAAVCVTPSLTLKVVKHGEPITDPHINTLKSWRYGSRTLMQVNAGPG